MVLLQFLRDVPVSQAKDRLDQRQGVGTVAIIETVETVHGFSPRRTTRVLMPWSCSVLGQAHRSWTSEASVVTENQMHHQVRIVRRLLTSVQLLLEEIR